MLRNNEKDYRLSPGDFESDLGDWLDDLERIREMLLDRTPNDWSNASELLGELCTDVHLSSRSYAMCAVDGVGLGDREEE